MGLKEMLVGLVFAGLFAFAFIGFSEQIALDNNANQSLLDDPSLSGFNNSIIGNLTKVDEQANQQERAFANSNPDKSSESGFGITAIFGTVLSFIGTSISIFNLILNIGASTLGIPPLILQIFLASLIIILLLLGWRVIKAGGT